MPTEMLILNQLCFDSKTNLKKSPKHIFVSCCCVCCCVNDLVVVFQRRKWRGWQRCALIRWSRARTRLPFGGAASSPRWDVCSNPGNGGRRRARSSSRPLPVRTEPVHTRQQHYHPVPHPSPPVVTHAEDECLAVQQQR